MLMVKRWVRAWCKACKSGVSTCGDLSWRGKCEACTAEAQDVDGWKRVAAGKAVAQPDAKHESHQPRRRIG